MRDLRNYGAHPRPQHDQNLERYFDDATCGTLILSTQRHLRQLAETVHDVLS